MHIQLTPKLFIVVIAATMFQATLNAQHARWERNAPGRLYTAKPPAISGFNIMGVYNVMNKIPVLAHPKGFDVQEWYSAITSDKPYTAKLNINFFRYYKQADGTVKRQNDFAPDLIIAINDRTALMDNQSVMFSEETNALKMQKIFTDTFELAYKTINGCRVGEGINTSFGRPVKFLLLNPSNKPVFRPVTVEEYARVFLKKLNAEIAEETKGLEESAKTFAELAKNPAFKNSMADMESSRNTMVKLVALKKSRKQYIEKKLASMTAGEKRAPARYAIYNDAPSNNGNGDRMGSHLLYEPYFEENGETLETKALYTFSSAFFESKAPKTALQLMVINKPFQVEQVDELKDYLNKELFPILPLKELENLMYP